MSKEKSNPLFKQTWEKIYPVIRQEKKYFIWGFIFVLLTTSIELYLPLIIGQVVDYVTVTKQFDKKLYYFIGGFLFLIILKSLFEAVQAYLIQSSGQKVTHGLRVQVFDKIQSLSVSFFDKNPTGRLLTRVMNDIKSLSEVFTASMSVLVLDFFIVVGTLVAMFYLHPKLALVSLITFPGVFLLIHFFGKRLERAYFEVRNRLAELNSFLGESVSAISTIQRLNIEENRIKKFDHILEAYQKAQMESLTVFAMVMPITNVINAVCSATLLVVGGMWVMKGEISIGILVTFMGYIRNLFQPVRDLVEKYNTFLSSMVAAERIVGILNEKSEYTEGTHVEKLTAFDLEFKNVSFAYPDTSKKVLDSIDFKVTPGESIAIVGATGSGKSTIIRLLLRFYDVIEGEILLGGIPIQNIDKKYLRSHIGVIQQEIIIIAGTVRENLTLGQKQYDDNYLIDQCKKAQIWNYLKAQKGLDTEILEGGGNLSLGQKQLIQLARILVLKTPLFILDEATASIDRISESNLMTAIRQNIKEATCIMIAHRLSTIQNCDKIIVLDKGKIIEQGTYSELLAKKGVFKKMNDLNLFIVNGAEESI